MAVAFGLGWNMRHLLSVRRHRAAYERQIRSRRDTIRREPCGTYSRF